MRPAPFELIQPTSLAEALVAMTPGSVPIAGGQSLIQALRLGTRKPTRIVDLSSIAELSDEISKTDDAIHIGAKVTHAELADHPLINTHLPWLATAAKKIGDAQVRALGTVIGNLCWADPRANMAVAMLASNATLSVTDPLLSSEQMDMPVAELFAGFQQTTLGSRIACSVKVPISPNVDGVYLEFSRQPQDLALVNVCVLTENANWRIAVGGIAARAVRLKDIEESMSIHADLRRLEHELDNNEALQPPLDAFGDRAYKLHLAATLIQRAITQLSRA